MNGLNPVEATELMLNINSKQQATDIIVIEVEEPFPSTKFVSKLSTFLSTAMNENKSPVAMINQTLPYVK